MLLFLGIIVLKLNKMPKGEIKLKELYIITIALVILVVATIVSLALRHLKLKKKHTMSMPATVVSTRAEQSNKGNSEETFYATFELHNNERREFSLPKHILDKIEIGKRGMIIFTSNHLLHFKEGEHPSHLFTHFKKINKTF